MKTISERMPGAKLISGDEIETQYQVAFGRDSFWLDLPTGKDPAEVRLIFVFSGAGGAGGDNNLTRIGTAGKFRREMLSRGFGFVCAVCSPSAFGDLESTEATLRASEYCRACGMNVPDRIPLLGFSMGGLGALMFAARHPERTARIADIFGITDLEHFYREGKYPDILGKLTQEERSGRAPVRKAERYRDIPILIVHGDADKIVDISHSERLYDALERQECPARFQVIPGYGHTNEILAAAGGYVKQFFEGTL